MPKHFCNTEIHTIGNKNIKLYHIHTTASNIKILSFSRKYGDKTKKTIQQSGEFGLNASWFAMNSDNHIMNLAYQNGVRQGYFLNDNDVPLVNNQRTDGFSNSLGKSIIYYRNGAVNYKTNVSSCSDSTVANSTWVQGGIGLYLGDANWFDKFVADGEGCYTDDVSARSAMVVHTETNAVYLYACQDKLKVSEFRHAIMNSLDMVDGQARTAWKGILLDGGGSTQLIGRTLTVPSSRPIPQMIALIDKN